MNFSIPPACTHFKSCKLIDKYCCLPILEPPEIVPFDFGSEVVNQREFAQLSCVVRKGDEPISITWSLKGDDLSSDPTMTTNTIGSRMSLLVITSVEYRHSGSYTCRAENSAGVDTYSAELKVNGRQTVIMCLCSWDWNAHIYKSFKFSYEMYQTRQRYLILSNNKVKKEKIRYTFKGIVYSYYFC